MRSSIGYLGTVHYAVSNADSVLYIVNYLRMYLDIYMHNCILHLCIVRMHDSIVYRYIVYYIDRYMHIA